jgi:ATP-binding cassette subfamily B protein
MGLYLSVVATAVIIESIRPYWLKMILDNAQTGESDKVFIYLLLFGFSTIGGNWISSLGNFLGDRVVIPFSRMIRETVFRKLMDLDFAFHVNRSTGSLISSFRRGDGAIFDLFQNLHSELFPVLVNLAVALFFLMRLSADLGLILILMFVCNLSLIVWLIKINLKYRSDFNEAEDNVSGVIADSVINYETVKFFAAENKESSNLSEKFDIWTKKFWKFANSFRLMDITIGTTSGAGMLWMLWLSVGQVGKRFTLGDLVMVSGFLTTFYYQFFNLFFRIRSIAKSMVDLEKYLGILDQKELVLDPEKPLLPEKLRGEIVFSHVSFAYPKDTDKTLSDIDLTINPGQRVAFVGRSGAGKTTLVRLLLRFYDPTEGKIMFDGLDIRRMKKTQLRLLAGVVPQEPIMFNNTIKFNLAYGNPEADFEAVRQAAEKANILDFIENLPAKWETQVGERGIKLSGGQKQRLAIARAILSEPKVLVFDEATSNLDSESELKIQAALKEVAKQRTVIIIAHRFSTIRDADKIFVLAGGTVVQSGNHKTLTAQNGVYRKLWELQAKGKTTLA